MEKAIKWIGIDAHSNFCETAVLNDQGNLISRRDIITNEKDMVEAIVEIRGERNIVVEESTIAQWLYVTLKPYANKIVISDPKVNKWIHAAENKNDKIDCRKLADLYRMGCISEVYHTDVEDLTVLRRLVMHYDRIMQNAIRAQNRIKSQYHYWGIFVKGASVYNSKKRNEYLKAIGSEEIRHIINNYYKQLDLYRMQQKEVLQKLRKMSRKYPILKKLRTIPGIGFVRAIIIFALIITPERFSKRNKLNKYCGLSVAEKKSAGKVYSSYASRTGNYLLKRVLIDTAITCISVCNNNYFKNRYEELLLKGFTEKAARRTIAREIMHVVMGVWKNNTSYSSQVHLKHRNEYLEKGDIKSSPRVYKLVKKRRFETSQKREFQTMPAVV